ncbi:hypothetical protein [Diaphorobacter caeni]|uniref:hypothetical protein n=1 Tax=Diaphorobacter caeni TaxID=2784387 RepID=UPI00188F2CE7|nr:hypothetical protein [Diaphorobacter caeni]MBF5006352.1 hypothetical protein [Diaphorobacter caeni]
MGNGTLVFSGGSNDGSGRLVFGEQGTAVIPDALFSVDAELPGLEGITLRTGVCVSVDAELPGMDADVGLRWDANVSRGGLRAELQSVWQEAKPTSAALISPWEEAARLRVATEAKWQKGKPIPTAMQPRWEATLPLRSGVVGHWQEGRALRTGLSVPWQDTLRLRSGVFSHWQDGVALRVGLAVPWQDTLRLRSGVFSHWQNGQPMRAAQIGRWRDGLPTRSGIRSHWEEARKPPPGVSLRPPVIVEPETPCYDPATVGRLIFSDLAMGDARLVFVCQRPGQVLPPAAIVIQPQRTYVVINEVEIRRADNLGGDPLPCESFSMSLNSGSWAWTFSATFHISAREAVTPVNYNQPIELEARVNGQPFRLLAEQPLPTRRFAEHTIGISGRSRAAHLDDLEALQTFGNTLDVSAHQLMQECLTVNGGSFGWDVDWQITDWIVPGGVWMHQGTWISAIADIAAATGGYLQPHDTDQIMRVLPLWPQPWWRFDQLTPDIELPEGYSEVDDTSIIYQPAYNRIFVSGETGGILADVTRAGTAGDILKQMVVHPLITEVSAAQQRAIAELSQSGVGLRHKMILPINATKGGVIKPGTILRYVDDSSAWRTGIVRSTSVAMQFPELTQSLEVESHV